jgi:hypothetical protein
MNTYYEELNRMKEDILKLFEENKTLSTRQVFSRFFKRFDYTKCKLVIMVMDRAAESLINEGKLEISPDGKFLTKTSGMDTNG